MPHMGVSVTEGTVVAWHKQPGDQVKADEPICDIATDKVDTEVVAPADGVLARVIAEVGATVAVGDALAELRLPEGRSTEYGSTEYGSAEYGVPRGRFEPAAAAEAVVSRPRTAGQWPHQLTPCAARGGGARRVDLARVTGSGLRGRVRKADVLAALGGRRRRRRARRPRPGIFRAGTTTSPTSWSRHRASAS